MAYKIAGVAADRGVRTQHDDYKAKVDKWQKCRDTIGGEDAIKAAGLRYVPKLRRQKDQDYTAMIVRGSFYNATARTVSGLLGMIFRKPAIQEVPTGIEALLKDVDMCGTPFDVFSAKITEECLSVGRVGLLIDHTAAIDTQGSPLTVAKAQAANLRPTMKIYPTESIINWRFAQVNNVWTLVQVVLTEQFSQPAVDQWTKKVSEFENMTENRYRVLDLDGAGNYRVRIFRIDDNNNDEQVGVDEYPVMNGKMLTEIPFIVMTKDGTSFEVDDPPLLDLINVNLAHWRSSVDYEHGCHFTALPTLFVAGYSPSVPEQGEVPEEIYLGSDEAIVLSNENAKAEFIEFTGQGLKAITDSMDRKEQQMAILGARMLATEGKQAQTATTTAIHRTGENSVLAQIAIGVSLGLSKALSLFSAWAGTVKDCVCTLNRDFLPVTVDGPTMTALMGLVQGGQLNKEEMFDWLQRADVIEATVSYEDHQAGDFVLPPPTIGVGNLTHPVGNSTIPLNPERAS